MVWVVRRSERALPHVVNLVAITGLVLALLMLGCLVPVVVPRSTEVLMPPRDVVQFAEDVFGMYQIPVPPHVPDSRRLESGEFVVEGSWGGEPVDARVDCGTGEDGMPRALRGPVTMTIALTAHSRPIRMPGMSVPVEGSLVEIDGRGILQDGVRCRLTRQFATAILCAVAFRAGSVTACDPSGRVG